MSKAYKSMRTSKKMRSMSEKELKEIRELVRKELSDELEEKNAITQYDNIPIQHDIPSGVVLNGQGNFFKLLPQIFQSSLGGAGSAYNERVGNEITLKELDIHGFLNYTAIPNVIASPQNIKLAVRVMILRAKDINDQETLFDNMPTGALLRFGQQSSGSGGPIPYNRLPLDSFRDINRDLFSVRYDEVHYMSGDSRLVVTDTTDLALNPSSLKIFRHKLKFGSTGLKLKYTSSSDTQPNNFPYFMVIGYSSMSANAEPADGLVQATFNISSKFTDA